MIEGRDSVKQQMELILYAGDRLVGDQLVEHHRQPGVAPCHPVERLQSRTYLVQGIQNVRAFFPHEIPPDDFNRLVEPQALQYLNVEEVVERLSDVGDAIEVQRCGGQQQATIVAHQEFAQGCGVVLVADLPAEYLAQVLEHDQHCPAAPAILLAYRRYQRVSDPGVVLFGLHLGVQLRPQRLVFKGLLQYSAHADQEVGEGQRPI